MNVYIYQVDYALHYCPFYLALERVKKNRIVFNIELIPTNSDKESIIAFEKGIKNDNNSLHVLLTGTIDLEKRIRESSKSEAAARYFSHNVILYTSLISKVPITIWERTNNKKKNGKISIYPKGSTAHWFANKHIEIVDNCEFIEVEFGEGKEFELLEEGVVDYAITLEAWRGKEKEGQIFELYKDMPNAPLGFTGIYIQKAAFDDDKLRDFLFDVNKELSIVINHLYHAFEYEGYNWEAGYSQDSIIREVASFYSKLENYQLGVKNLKSALTWMSQKQIWALTDAQPIKLESEKMLSLQDLIENFNQDFKMKRMSLMSIHNLKNDLREHIITPIDKVITASVDELTKKKLENICNFVQGLSEKYENFLLAFQAYNNNNKYEFGLEEMEEIVGGIAKEKKQVIKKDITIGSKTVIDVPSIFMEFILSGLVDNAINYYPKEKATVDLEITIGMREVIKNDKEQIEVYVKNTGSRIASHYMPYIGLYPLESKREGSSGNFLVFVNGALDILKAEQVERTKKRYFSIRNLQNPQAVQILFYFNKEVIT